MPLNTESTGGTVDISSSAAVKLKQSDVDVSSVPLLTGLVEGHLGEMSVEQFLRDVKSYSQTHNLMSPIEFPIDHPVEEVARSSLNSLHVY